MKNSLEKLVLLFALALIFIFGFFSILDKSMTWDERCYIGAGKYILNTGNFQYNIFAYHPPLSFYINSIFIMPFKFGEKIFSNDNCWIIGNDMVYHSGYSPRLMLILARLPFILMSMILALYIFYWAKQLYGIKSGLLAIGLYTFSTSIISQSNLAMTDFTVTFFIFTTMYYYWKFSLSNKNIHLFLASIFFGFAMLSKLTGLILIPVLMIMIFYDALKDKRGKKRFLSVTKKLSIIFIIGFFIMFAGYGFQFKPLKDVMPNHYVYRAYEEFNKQIQNNALRKSVVYAFEKVPIPFPSYFFGFGSVSFHSKEGQGSFLNGRIFLKTPWYYPIAVFFYKTQISLFALIILSIFYFNKTKSKYPSYEYIQILPILVIFILFMLSNMTAGLRHIIPVYPFIFLFCGKIARLKNGWINTVLVILFVYYTISSLLIFPNYMVYFNEFAGGAGNGYKHLVGGNLDQGQDLPGLKKFMEENHVNKINLSYFGSIDPKEYVNYDYLPSPYFQPWVPDFKWNEDIKIRKEDCSEKKGWVAVSATNLQNVHLINATCFNWLKKYTPVKKIGYSIFVYDIKI